MTTPSLKIAIVGAGMAGATCAHALAAAGHLVFVFDKSRGPGGRMATRRAEWAGSAGERRLASFDHGAPSFEARGTAFRELLARASEAGVVAAWAPTLAPASRPLEGVGSRYLAMPDMPSLCRWLLQEARTHWSFAVERLHRSALGWQVEASGEALAGPFDAVLLALPAAQAAPLLSGFRPDWASRAAAVAMAPCWTLMGVTRSAGESVDLPEATSALPPEVGWDLGLPRSGLLKMVLRQDARPGRYPSVGEAHWVLHAHAAWSEAKLEQPAEWVKAQMQGALHAWLQETFPHPAQLPLHWQHAVVHRWRYAQPPEPGASVCPAEPDLACWWDPTLRLGVCGDFLGVGAQVIGCGDAGGVERAWLSAQTLVAWLEGARLRDSRPGQTGPAAALGGTASP